MPDNSSEERAPQLPDDSGFLPSVFGDDADTGAGPSGARIPIAPQPAPPPAAPQPMRRAPLQYQPNEPGWWLGADGLWYPPETQPGQPASGPAISNSAPGSQNVVVNVGMNHPVQAAYVSAAPKSKVAAGLLGIFLGGFGVHRFYLGNVGLGITMLLISLLSVFVLAPFVAIWGFIEGIVILAGGIKTDARGIPLS